MIEDLTRWNRAGLSRFRYVDGNAATYLEILREDLAGRFPEWELVQVPEETDAERADRIVEQYERAATERPPELGGGKDWGWEIARAFSRALHVVTEHLDSYANEGFLDTATQWESVRRLVGTLGYRPTPPASASCPLVLTAKAAGTLAGGFGVQHVPRTGPPVVFETLEELRIAPDMNLLRPRGAGRSPDFLPGPRSRPTNGDEDPGPPALRLATDGEGVAIGQPLVVTCGERRSLHIVQAVRATTDAQGEPELTVVLDTAPPPFPVADTYVHLRSRERVELLGPRGGQPRPGGTSLQLRTEPSGLAKGDVVQVSDGTNTYLRRVKDLRGRRIAFTEPLGALDTARASVAPTAQLAVTDIAERVGGGIRAIRVPGDWRHLQGRTVGKPEVRGDRVVEYEVMGADYVSPQQDHPDRGMTRLRATRGEEGDGQEQLADLNPQRLHVGPTGPGPWQADGVLDRRDGALPQVLETPLVRRLGPEDLLVLARGGQVAAATVAGVMRDGATARITVQPGSWSGTGGGPWFLADTVVHAGFGEAVRVVGWDRDETPLEGGEVTLDHPLPALLARGRRVVLESPEEVVSTVVTDVDPASGAVTFADPVPEGATVGSLRVRANVVAAGHGETRGERVLGSGDAAARNQRFRLEVPDVSFVDDPTRASGVRADLQVTVQGRRWQQVASLAASGATDAHYSVEPTEDGDLVLTFGDGVHGRRLPTGQNNVRVSYRQGSGGRGMVEAGGLTRPLRPSPWVEAVEQPIGASGGSSREETSSLRRNAPSTLLALDRAVSLTDLAHLATANSRVWDAVALPLSTFPASGPAKQPGDLGRGERVGVAIVPAEGKEVGSELEASIQRYLSAHAVPGVDVVVLGYRPVRVKVTATVRVDTGSFDPAGVVAAVKQALTRAFALRSRRLGQHLHRSDVVAVIEAVEGVVNSRSRIESDDSPPLPPPIRALRVDPDQIVMLSEAADALLVDHEEATP
jgi:hypothetical protein